MKIKEILDDPEFNKETIDLNKTGGGYVGKIIIVIHYEDGSYREYRKRIADNYFIKIKKQTYFVVPHAIIMGRRPAIHYYHNKIMPIKFHHDRKHITVKDLYENKGYQDLDENDLYIMAGTTIDAAGLNAAFDSHLLKGLYAKPGLSGKMLIIIFVVVAVLAVVLLQATGTVDIASFFTGGQ